MKTKNLDGRELFGITLGENNSIEGGWKRYFKEVYNDEETTIDFITKKVYTELYDKTAIWYKGKARCVIKFLGNEPVNKLKAICVIPECDISEEDRNLLKENLKRIKEEERKK